MGRGSLGVPSLLHAPSPCAPSLWGAPYLWGAPLADPKEGRGLQGGHSGAAAGATGAEEMPGL